MRTLPLLENRKSGGYKVKDFLGEGDYQPTGQGEETPVSYTHLDVYKRQHGIQTMR